MLFKRCTRCQGDLFQEEDLGQIDLVCLQCGYRRTIGSQMTKVRLAELKLRELVGAKS